MVWFRFEKLKFFYNIYWLGIRIDALKHLFEDEALRDEPKHKISNDLIVIYFNKINFYN
jgi:hypothetical protein